MATAPEAAKSPARTTVRDFLNLSAPLPDYGAVSQPEAELRYGRSGRYLSYGVGNVVPVVAMAAKQASPTAYRCIERREQFLVGTGFPVPERDPATGLLRDPTQAGTLGETPVPGHPGKTANDLWAELCSYAGNFNGAAALVRYTGIEGGYAIGEIHVLPFGAVRKTTAGTYLLNHRFGRPRFSATQTTEHLPFNPDRKRVKREMTDGRAVAKAKQKPYVQAGQIFYIYTPKAGEEDYPLPPQWPGLDSLLTEAAYESYDLSEVRRGFRAKGVLVILGEADDKNPDENGQTEADKQDALLRRLTVAGAQEQGAEREDVLVMNADSKDAAPVWIPMATTTDLKWLTEKKEGVGQEVCRHLGIPPILAGFAKAGQLGAVQELVNAAQLTQNSLEPTRQMLLRAFWQLMPSLNGLVPGKLNPIDVATATVAAQPAKPAPGTPANA